MTAKNCQNGEQMGNEHIDRFQSFFLRKPKLQKWLEIYQKSHFRHFYFIFHYVHIDNTCTFFFTHAAPTCG